MSSSDNRSKSESSFTDSFVNDNDGLVIESVFTNLDHSVFTSIDISSINLIFKSHGHFEVMLDNGLSSGNKSNFRS